MKLKTYTYNTHRGRTGLYNTIIGKAKIEQAGLQYAIETAEKLQALEIKATINKKSIEKTKEIIIEYDKGIKKKIKEFKESDSSWQSP